MTLGTAPTAPPPNPHEAAAVDAAAHLDAYLTAYVAVGLALDKAFDLYCLLAARPSTEATR